MATGKDERSSILRIIIIGFVLLFFYGIIAYRLWDEQVRRGEKHRQRVSRQSIRAIRIPAVRGRIYTSDMHLLADNIPSYDVIFHIKDMRKPGRRSNTIKFIFDTYKKISRLIGRKGKMTAGDIQHHMNYRPGLPINAFKDLSTRELSILSELTPPLQGVEVIANPVRFYPEGKTACHILGYVGPDDPKSAEDRKDYFYYIPDLVGKSGLERNYDSFLKVNANKEIRGLRGSAGESLVRVNFLGFVHKELREPTPPKSGNDIILTLDWEAQKAAEKVLETMLNSEQNGAIVLLNADTGAVLAMASYPGYNLQDFVPKLSAKTWKKLTYNNPRHPMFNRATLGQFTPGSIVKPLVALALLKNGTDPTHNSNCQGKTYIGDTRIRCWAYRSGGHGRINLVDSIKQSCNVYFIERGVELGMKKITEMMGSAGIGRKTGFPLAERKGLLPKREDKHRIYGTSWNAYDTGLLSMGQGIILLTPLQAAIYTAAFANGGTLWKPYIFNEIKTQSGKVLLKNKPVKTGQLATTPEHLDVIKEGMWRVVNASDGSAKKARNRYIELYGKTGTAEVRSGRNKTKNTWFICFGDYHDKRYALVVFVEHGASGGRTSAPMAGRFFDEWLSKKEP